MGKRGNDRDQATIVARSKIIEKNADSLVSVLEASNAEDLEIAKLIREEVKAFFANKKSDDKSLKVVDGPKDLNSIALAAIRAQALARTALNADRLSSSDDGETDFTLRFLREGEAKG